MNTATFTIESVHGIKQTIVLMPNGSKESAEKPSASHTESQSNEDNRPRVSK